MLHKGTDLLNSHIRQNLFA